MSALRQWFSPAALLRSLAFAGVYAFAVFLGRLTVLEGTSISLVWPAAGVAALWLAAQRGTGTWPLDHALVGALTFVVTTAMGAPALLALCFGVANVVQVAVLQYLLHRWHPNLWGAGGDQPLTGTQQLTGVLLATVLATAAGAALGPLAVGVVTGQWSPVSVVVWMVRNTACVLLILGLGLRVGYLLTRPRQGKEEAGLGQPRPAVLLPLMRLDGPRRVELAALVVVSVTAYLLVFVLLPQLPVAYPLIALTVWAALRFDTTIVVMHDFLAGTAAVAFTLTGHGPFTSVDDVGTRALIVQAFVALVALVGMALALGRDEREVLLGEVRRRAQEAAERAEQVEILARLARQLYTSDDVRTDICVAARQITGADMAYLLEPTGAGDLASTAASSAALGAQVPPVGFSLTNGEPSLTVKAFHGRELVFIGDMGARSDASLRVVEGLRVGAAAWQPVHTHAEQAIAVLALAWHHPVRSLPAQVSPMLQTLAGEAAIAIERGDLLVRLATAAKQDALTGLPNRLRWDEAATEEVARAERHGLPLTFALIDLDHFKRYNDSRGHLAGDALLRDFAEAARQHMRVVDTLARWGGEEFAMALPGCTAQEAAVVADRVRASVPRAQTCTIGIAQWQPGQNAQDVLNAADAALYRGKRAGRNTTVLGSLSG
ncbi:diguanylate cyclase [Kineosporia rhizophila]|uniref:sensor domain-containing diguanylate cyclase n=1 Tax=Kineosporia rhizophila TaxID=84633 RepID=UPI001E4F63E7|nr:diguanylate cyclase [Kineosporia rhizophila]